MNDFNMYIMFLERGTAGRLDASRMVSRSACGLHVSRVVPCAVPCADPHAV